MDDMLTIIPIYYRINNPIFFLFQMIFVSLIFSGILHLWEIIRKKLRLSYSYFFIEASIAVIAISFIIFPLFFLSALAGWYRQALIIIQLIFLFFAFYKGFILKILTKLKEKTKSLSFGEYLIILYLIFFIYWSWIMPFTERYNGHFCTFINTIQNMWKTGFFTLMEKNWVNYDNQVYIWPVNLSFFLSIFSLPYFKLINIRPLFLIPGILSFLAWRLMRVNAKMLFQNAGLGDLAFLLVAFSYNHLFNSMIYFDIFSPLMIAFFIYCIIEVFRNKRGANIHFIILALSFTFLMRRQLFLLFLAILFIIYILNINNVKKTHFLRGYNKYLIIFFLIPAMFWAIFTFIKYDSPFFPHDTNFTEKIFSKAKQKPLEPYVLAKPNIPAIKEESRQKSFIKQQLSKLKDLKNHRDPNSNINFYVENFFPIHLSKGFIVFLKNIFCGLSVSLLVSLGLLGYLCTLFFKKEQESNRKIVCSLLIGYFIILYVFFLNYIRYAQYLAYIASPFASYFYARLLKKEILLRFFMLIILGLGIFSWSYNEWGHMGKSAPIENIKFLNPYYKNAIYRIARKSSRSVDDVKKELHEIIEFKKTGGKILYMDIEPGLFIPTILNLENFANSLFFESESAEKLYKAKNITELKKAVNFYGITHIYKPGRSHSVFKDTLLLKLLRQEKEYDFVVPAETLFKLDSIDRQKGLYPG